jgi:hypothetical protein
MREPVGQAGTDGAQHGEVCVANISLRERRQRLTGGFVQFGLGLAMLAVLLNTGRNRCWRLMLLPMFGGAAAGFFQWRDKT